MSPISTAVRERSTEQATKKFIGAILAVMFFGVFILAWQLFFQVYDSVLIPAPLGTLRALGDLLVETETWRALWTSNQSLIIGFIATVLIGTTLGILIARLGWLERLVDPWLNVLLVLPMVMFMPVIIMAFGFSLSARVFIVILFAFPVVVVNTRAGIKEVPTELIEMARVFGATETDVWKQILVKASAPAIWTGYRLGLGRSITGMILGELLLVAVGIGRLFQLFKGEFEPDKTFALVCILVVESLVLLRLLRFVERRAIPWANTDTYQEN
ncbi:MAG: ABC transporter permease [Ilumatobacteraceae bacterium]